MPFINNTLFVRRAYGPPTLLLDAYRLVSCEDVITLNAETVDGQPGDTFLWEQIGGSLVIWLTPLNEQEVTYNQNLVRDDKTFRVTINEGTAREVIGTIVVSAIPRDTVQWLSRPLSLFAQKFDAEDRTYSDLESVAVSYMMPGLSDPNTVTVLNSNRWMGFTPPPDSWLHQLEPDPSAPVIGFKLFDITSGGFTEVASIPYNQRSFYGLEWFREYQIVSEVLQPGYPHESLGAVAGYFPPVGYLDLDSFEPSTMTLSRWAYQEATHYPRELIAQAVEDEDGFRINLNSALLTTTALHYPRELISREVEDDDGFRINLQVGKFTLTRFQLDLGVGSLG